MTFRSLLPLIAAAAIIPSSSLHAATVLYSFSGKGAKGSFKGVAFTAKNFTITTSANSSDVFSLPDAGLYLKTQAVRVQPTIELFTDIGDFKLTLPVSESFAPTIRSSNYDGKYAFYSLVLAAPNPAALEKVSKLLDLDPALFTKDQDLFATVASFFSKDPDPKTYPAFAERYPDLFLKLSSLSENDPALFEQIIKTFQEYPNALSSTLELAAFSEDVNDLRSPAEFDGLWTDGFSFSSDTSMGDLSFTLDDSSFDGSFAVSVFDGPADPSPVPEPATAASSLLLSIAGLSLVSRRKRKA